MSAIEFTPEELQRPVDLSEQAGHLALSDVSAVFHMSQETVRAGRCREQRFVAARRALYARLRDLGWSYPRIGRFCGGAHRTTVMYALKPNRRAYNKERLARAGDRPTPPVIELQRVGA